MSDDKDWWSVCIDTGGTFTDCIAISPGGYKKRIKVLSSSALRGKIMERCGRRKFRIHQEWEAPDDFIQGFTFSLLHLPKKTSSVVAYDAEASILELSDPMDIEGIAEASFEVKSEEEAPVLAARLATATKAGEQLPPINLRLATTRGTNALLENKGARTALFVSRGYEDLLEIGTQQRPDLFALNVQKSAKIFEQVLEVPERLSAEGEAVEALDVSALEGRADALLKEGITTAAVALMHSYKNSRHEEKLKNWLLDKGFSHVSVSSELSPFIGIIPRAETTLVNAYLAPIIEEYLESVKSSISRGDIFVMTSAGGLTADDAFTPKDSLLSGPAGGVVGAATEGKKVGSQKVISFDMGGTSTDVARYDHDYEYTFEHKVGDAHMVAPTLFVETVAAGGGSVCYYDGHKLCVGPESAGAHPGPACYGAGGPLTITDVNLLMGRLDQENFHIPVSPEDAEKRLREITNRLNENSGQEVTKASVLQSFLNIANERMADAIRKISIRKGYDTREYALVSFGGAGGQHACAIARNLDMKKVIVPDEAGLLSATGLRHAVVEEFAERQVLKALPEVENSIGDILEDLATEAIAKLSGVISDTEEVSVRRKILSMRFLGQESTLEVEYESGDDIEELFQQSYKRQYGHWVSDRTIEITSVRVVASTRSEMQEVEDKVKMLGSPAPYFQKQIWFGGEAVDTPVYRRGDLEPGHQIKGPALILDPHSTIVLEPDWSGIVEANNTLMLEQEERPEEVIEGEQPEAARLELFTNRFSSIASEMGEKLQRTALSVNVKDRLDFSCALLSPEGELVVNAPHIPVHLGALGLCVRRVAETIAMDPGDVVITNHPAYGGSHLPDVTVITPVFTGEDQLIGYAASRAHHAEIGGVTPGSMPPDATSLEEEGVVIPPMYLIRKGKEKWEQITSHLQRATYPSRNIEENIADLQAAVAANQRGVHGLRQMVDKHGLDQVHHYMNALKEHAASKMKKTFRNIPNGQYEGEEFLDDGTPVKVCFNIGEDNIAIDFTGTGSVHPNNLNATPAIVNSVVMYVLRLLIDEPLPLNEGILEPVRITLPNSLLNPTFYDDPAESPAVVGGNVEISQRLVDTLLKPFEIVACSQGTMNNVLFGNDHFGYYETVGGGTGAGPDFNGTDAVHHHMTNTKGTDPEILEYRYPVRLLRYAVRKSSGGGGEYKGGNGITRELLFLEPVRLTVLTQHRKEKPYGLRGGEPGMTGEQWVWYADGRKEQLASVDGRDLDKGDRFILRTPGGGGFGTADKQEIK